MQKKQSAGAFGMQTASREMVGGFQIADYSFLIVYTAGSRQCTMQMQTQ